VQILENGDAVRCLQDVGVDVVGLVDFADFIFEADGVAEEAELEFHEFMNVVLQLRGSNTATVKDIVDLRKFVQNQFDQQRKDFREQCRALRCELHSAISMNATKTSRCGFPSVLTQNSAPAKGSVSERQVSLNTQSRQRTESQSIRTLPAEASKPLFKSLVRELEKLYDLAQDPTFCPVWEQLPEKIPERFPVPSPPLPVMLDPAELKKPPDISLGIHSVQAPSVSTRPAPPSLVKPAEVLPDMLPVHSPRSDVGASAIGPTGKRMSRQPVQPPE